MSRLLRILAVALRFRLYRFLPRFSGEADPERAVRLRQALEALGPIFVKFGQMLSTRRDLLPPDISDELAKLQDRVPPFPSEQVLATLARAYGKPVDQVFKSFDLTPVASASVAQVHFAHLPDGTPVAVKVLRPDIHQVIDGFVEAARRARTAGFDGVEVHGANGYLLDQFLTTYTNRRTDEYGGPPENRVRLVVELLQAVHAGVGSDFPVGVRVSQVTAETHPVPMEFVGVQNTYAESATPEPGSNLNPLSSNTSSSALIAPSTSNESV